MMESCQSLTTSELYIPTCPVFSRELFTVELFHESQRLYELHAKEVCGFPGHELNPDTATYILLEQVNKLRVFTARNSAKSNGSSQSSGQLIGYSIYLLGNHLHYQSLHQANHYLAFIDPEHRGFGRRFLQWCEGELKVGGVNFMVYSAKPGSVFYKLIESMDTKLIEHQFTKEI